MTLELHKKRDQAVAMNVPENKTGCQVLPTKKLLSISLFNQSKEVMIEHQNEIYYLRITKQNKLILTK